MISVTRQYVVLSAQTRGCPVAFSSRSKAPVPESTPLCIENFCVVRRFVDKICRGCFFFSINMLLGVQCRRRVSYWSNAPWHVQVQVANTTVLVLRILILSTSKNLKKKKLIYGRKCNDCWVFLFILQRYLHFGSIWMPNGLHISVHSGKCLVVMLMPRWQSCHTAVIILKIMTMLWWKCAACAFNIVQTQTFPLFCGSLPRGVDICQLWS